MSHILSHSNNRESKTWLSLIQGATGTVSRDWVKAVIGQSLPYLGSDWLKLGPDPGAGELMTHQVRIWRQQLIRKGMEEQ